MSSSTPGADRPLARRCVLIIRSREQAGALAAAVTALGGSTWEYAAVAILDPADWTSVDAAAARLEQFAWVAFTSANGVDRFLTRLRGQGVASGAPGGIRCATVGKATAAALTRWGLSAHLLPDTPDAESLATQLVTVAGGHGEGEPPQPVLVVRPEHPAYDVAGHLRRAGIPVTEAVAYRIGLGSGNLEELKQALATGQIHYAAITSPSGLDRLLAALGDSHWLAGVRLACMGPKTAAAVAAAGLPVATVAVEPTVAALAAAIAADAAPHL